MLGGGLFFCIHRDKDKDRRTWKNDSESALTSVLLRSHTSDENQSNITTNNNSNISNTTTNNNNNNSSFLKKKPIQVDVLDRDKEFTFNHSLNRNPGPTSSAVKRSLSATQSSRSTGKSPSDGSNTNTRNTRSKGRLPQYNERNTFKPDAFSNNNRNNNNNDNNPNNLNNQNTRNNSTNQFDPTGSSSRYQRQRRRRQQNTLGPRSVMSAEDSGPYRASQRDTNMMNNHRRKMMSPGGVGRISRISTAPVKRRKRFQDIFELGSVVGRGAMCAVHQCHLRVSGEVFAVKVFKTNSAEQHSVLQQLAAEISTHRLLSHPNIVSLRACFQEPEAMYVVMEYLAGGDLLDRILNKIASGDPYQEQDAAHVMKSIFSALSHLHNDHNMAHRDIKPENILLADINDDLTVKLADFGTAVRLPGRRRAHSYTGSPQYMAPEVCATLNGLDCGTGYSEACDMWSCGVVLYILVCQGMPFSTSEGEDEEALAAMQLNIQRGNYSMEPCERLGLSTEVQDLLTSLLCVDPEERLTSSQALEHEWIAQVQ